MFSIRSAKVSALSGRNALRMLRSAASPGTSGARATRGEGVSSSTLSPAGHQLSNKAPQGAFCFGRRSSPTLGGEPTVSSSESASFLFNPSLALRKYAVRASCRQVDPVFCAQRCAGQELEHRIDPKSGIHFWVRCSRATPSAQGIPGCGPRPALLRWESRFQRDEGPWTIVRLRCRPRRL
jgi:hypothetical protein